MSLNRQSSLNQLKELINKTVENLASKIKNFKDENQIIAETTDNDDDDSDATITSATAKNNTDATNMTTSRGDNNDDDDDDDDDDFMTSSHDDTIRRSSLSAPVNLKVVQPKKKVDSAITVVVDNELTTNVIGDPVKPPQAVLADLTTSKNGDGDGASDNVGDDISGEGGVSIALYVSTSF